MSDRGLTNRSGVEPELSIVIPALNEDQNVRPLYRALEATLRVLGLDWEMVFADDGSSDRTWAEIVALHADDCRVRGVRLSRNFGHQPALLAGLSIARGRAVITMDADLQHPPDVVPQLVEEWRRGYLIVSTVRLDGAETKRLKKLSSRLFYRVYSALSGVEMDAGTADFRLLDRQVLDQVLRFRESGLFLRGLVQWVGFPSTQVLFRCGERAHGTTKYSMRRMVSFAWTAIKAFSIRPLRLATFTGAVTSSLAFLALVYAAGAELLGFYTMPGWASILSIVSFLFGVLFILLGVIGEYVGEILLEVRQRPRFLVREQLPVLDVEPRVPDVTTQMVRD